MNEKTGNGTVKKEEKSMPGETTVSDSELVFHIQEVLQGKRRFETAAQSVSRMIREKGVEKITHGGKTVYDYPFFREGDKHIIGWFDEVNALVHFLRDAAEGGSAKEMGIVFISEPASGKTFFIEYLCKKYRLFISRPENTRYTFSFVGLDKAFGYHEKVAELSSATLEDPMILVMNLFKAIDESKEHLAKMGFKDNDIEKLYKQRRPLGASTEYLWWKLMEKYGDIQKSLEHVKVAPVPIMDSVGTITGKYQSGDKITSSSVDLVGEEDLQRILYLPLDDPNRFNLRRGALARIAGGGIHFADEIFKNKTDLIKIYLGVTQDRRIEKDSFSWPIDALIIATSNTDEYNEFVSQAKESPIVSRFRAIYVSHNTDYKLQHELTGYALGNEKRTTVLGEPMHIDPNLIYATSVGVVLTRLLRSEKLDPIDIMKLEAGEIAGEHGVKSLVEIKEEANKSPDITQRWGQKGLGHRDLGKALQVLLEMPESHEGKCLFAKDVFKALERIILDYVKNSTDRNKFLEDLKTALQLYREKIKTDIFNAFRDDPNAIRKDVMLYINMIIGMDAKNLGPDKIWKYRDPQTGELKPLKIDLRYVNSVEERLGLRSKEQRESFRTTIRKIYGQKIPTEPNYDFMDQQDLVKAVTDVRLESEVAGAASLVGALANRTNEENVKLYNRMIKTMCEKLGYCFTCALKTIEYFCEKDDES